MEEREQRNGNIENIITKILKIFFKKEVGG